MNKHWYYLTGTNQEFSLESRIFHSFCIVAFFILIISASSNLILGLPIPALLAFVAFFFQSGLYYLSRFRYKTQISRRLSIIIIHIVLIINYLFNSGIQGPSLLLLLAIFFLVISLSKPKEYWLFVSLNLTVVIGLLLIEYLNPEIVEKSYRGPIFYFGDIATSYFLSVLIILIGLRYIKKNYYISQNLLEIKAADLERINSTKNKLFTIVSHDLRAPLATVRSYLEILSHLEPGKENWQEIQSDLIEMTQNTDNMLSNILMWSTSQMEGISINKKSIFLAETLLPVIRVFQSIASAKQITLSFDIDPGLKVIADENMLQLVIRNVLSNAIKFTNNGGAIQLKVDSDYPNYVIKVSDNGIGMTEQIKDSIFSLKAESSFGTKNEKGVGLGLNLSKEFTEMQGGRIWFESTYGRGTTFYISLPIS
jgi:two-component system, sensor histidine kinase and response regulator